MWGQFDPFFCSITRRAINEIFGGDSVIVCVIVRLLGFNFEPIRVAIFAKLGRLKTTFRKRKFEEN